MRTALAILLLFVFAALGWLLWSAAPAEPPVEIDAPGPAPPREPPGSLAPPPALASADAIAVVVEIETRAHLAPPMPVPQFEVWRGQQQLSLPAEAVAGAYAGEFESQPGDRTLVRLDLGAAGSCWRAVTAALAAPTRIRFGPLCRVGGGIVDAAGKPVVGAKVWTGAVGPDGDLLEVETDGDGRFAVDVMQGAGVPVVVQKPGLASRAQWLDLGPDGASEVLLTMEPETVVAVQCAVVADSLQGAVVGVLPGEASSTGMLQWPFFLQAVRGLTELDATGRAELRGLPRDAEVRVVVQHPLAMLSSPVQVALRGGRATALVPLRLLPQLSGRVVDAAGRPVAGALVRTQLRDQQPRPNGRWMLPERLCLAGASLGVTGDDGRFAVGFAGKACQVTVRRPGGAALQFTVDRQGPVARDLKLPEWVEAPTLLQVPAPGAAAWFLRIKPALADFVEVAAGQPFEQPLAQPQLADLRVLVRTAGKWSTGKELRDAVVIGTFAVPAELLK